MPGGYRWLTIITLALTTPRDAVHAYDKDHLLFPETSQRNTKALQSQACTNFNFRTENKGYILTMVLFFNLNLILGKDTSINSLELGLFLNMLNSCEPMIFQYLIPKERCASSELRGREAWEAGHVGGSPGTSRDRAEYPFPILPAILGPRRPFSLLLSQLRPFLLVMWDPCCPHHNDASSVSATVCYPWPPSDVPFVTL